MSNIVDKLIDGYDGDVKKWAIDIAKVSITIPTYWDKLHKAFIRIS